MAHSNSLEHAQNLTKQLEENPDGEKTIAVNRELQKDRENMTPQEYNQLLRDMQSVNQADRSRNSNLPEIHIYSNYKGDIMAGIVQEPKQVSPTEHTKK